jgi:peptide subunit release factor 1 (eRF1)
MEETVDRNIKESAEFASRFFEENHVRRVLIGGTDANTALFRAALPKAWQSLVKGTFAMSMTASHTEVLSRAMQVGMEAQQQHESRQVERMITAAAKGEGGVSGIEGTLESVNDGRVQMLVISEGFRYAGYRCTACGRLTAVNGGSCKVCGGELERINDIVEMVVSAVMRASGEVLVVNDGPAMQQAGNIGAILRY